MYDVDYNTAIENLLVPDKRTKKTLAFNIALALGIANNHNLLFNIYKNYEILPNWITAFAYNKNDLVKYSKSVFQSIENGNTSRPTNSSKWRLVSENFLGSDFRLSITGEKLNLEYAINTWFGSTFRQPSVGISDIYFTTNNLIELPVFRVGINEFESTSVRSDGSDQFVINSYTFTAQYNLTINVPIALFNSLGTTNEIRTSIVRAFADKYINAGLTYKIQTY
jgi:hypothetical protein